MGTWVEVWLSERPADAAEVHVFACDSGYRSGEIFRSNSGCEMDGDGGDGISDETHQTSGEGEGVGGDVSAAELQVRRGEVLAA